MMKKPPKEHLFLTLFFFVFLLGHVRAAQPSILQSIGDRIVPTNAPSLAINLTQYVRADPATNLVRVTTSLPGVSGTPLGFTLQLFPSNAPKTVSNFLAYANDGAYENMLIHRSVPGFVIQTGGYEYDGKAIPVWTNIVPSEYGLSNIRGTVAMALSGSDSNSATDQWFINLTNNSSTLDDTNTANIPTYGTNGVITFSRNPPFTVFAKVIGNGMQVVDSMAQFPTINFGSPFDTLPVLSTNTTSLNSLTNLIHISRVATIPYFALSSDSAAYSPRISNSTLFIDYTGGTNPPSNPVTISLIATDTNGLTTNTSFQVWYLTNQVRFINYPVITNQPYTTNPFYLPYWPSTSDGTALSGNNISFSGPLGFGKDGKAYFTGTGTLTFTYVQPANVFYRAVTNSASFVIGKGTQTITFPALTTNSSNSVVYTTNPFTITNPPFSSSKLPVAISIASNSTARWKITNSQLLIAGAGTVTLVANQYGNSNYLAALPVTNTLVVTKAPQTITFPNIPNQNLNTRNPSPLVPLKAVSSSGLPVQYRVVSGNTKGFVTNSSLQITGVGVVAVEASLPESSNFLVAVSVTNTVTAKYAQTLKPFGKIPAKTFIYPFASFPVTVPTTDSMTSTNVVLTATPTNIATITGNSIVTITGAGTVTLTASQLGDDFYFPTSVSTSFVVAKAPQTITPFQAIPVKTNGIGSFPITVPIASSALPVTITASGAGYASTNGTNVMITLTNSGNVTVTATQAGNKDYLPAKALTTSFIVAKGNQSINFPAINTNHVFGDTFPLQAMAVPSGLPVSYRIIAGTNAAKLINGTSINVTAPIGTVTIVASQIGSSGYNAAIPKTNSFMIAQPQTNSGNQSTGGSISLGGGNALPYYPPVVTNGPTSGN
jgi:cyclophilin family peptidyl-prolyl cis-trans isomerase